MNAITIYKKRSLAVVPYNFQIWVRLERIGLAIAELNGVTMGLIECIQAIMGAFGMLGSTYEEAYGTEKTIEN